MFIQPPPESADTARLYDASAQSEGFVMNLTKAWAWRPDVFTGFAALRNQLTGAAPFSKRELAVMVCAAASQLGDAYCALAWGRTLVAEAGAGAARAVLAAQGDAALTRREAALAAWARQVVKDPNATTPADIARLREAGLGDREIFEATVFIAFRLAFSTVNDALGIPPDAELAQALPAELRAAVSFGRAGAT